MKLLEENLHSRPAVTYEQKVGLLSEVVGVRVSKSTVCRAIKRIGYTRKKIGGYSRLCTKSGQDTSYGS